MNLIVRPPIPREEPTLQEIETDWRKTHQDLMSDDIEGVIHDARRDRLSRRLDRLADQLTVAMLKAALEKRKTRRQKSRA